MNGESVNADRHRFGRDDGELLAVGAVFVESVDHLAADGARPGAFEFDDLLRFRGINVESPELASTITEKDDEVVGLASLDFVQNSVLLGFIDFSRQTAVSDGVLDDGFVGLCTRLFE